MGNLAVDTAAAPVDLTSVAGNALLCALLALLLAWHFRKFGSTFSNRSKFAAVLVPIGLTTMLVITVVKSNLVLSLGLVGALSIVRFRTPVKEPEELAYLFLAIALGLGIGAEQKGLTVSPPGPREVTVLVVGIILAVLTLRASLRRDTRFPNLYLNLEVAPGPTEETSLTALLRVVTRHARQADLRRLDTSDDLVQATLYVDVADPYQLTALEADLRRHYPDAKLTFVEQAGLPGA